MTPFARDPHSTEFALMLSRQCNIECRHCGIESSPRIRERVSRTEAERLIRQAAAIPAFGKVTFTGGEPFLFADDLEHLLRVCAGLGLETRVVTNGFWARDKEHGLTLLGRLRAAGLSEINFSADRYHLEFIPAQTLRNALDCAKAHGLNRIVSFVSNAERDPIEEFAALYDLPRDDLFDIRFISSDETLINEIGREHILLFYGGLIGLGRAGQSLGALRHFPVEIFPLGTPCNEIVNKPVIYPDGSFQACCSAGGKISSFTVGNAGEESLTTLYARMHDRAQFHLISTHGPRQLWACVQAARPDLALPEAYPSICEMCVRAAGALPPADIDRIAEDFLIRETLSLFGIRPAASSA